MHSLDDLKSWLHDVGIDSRSWGEWGAKTVVDLWGEIARGETTIQLQPPLRIVSVVEIIIRRDGCLLTEIEQEFGDGRRRARNRLPSEKISPGESYVESAYRCLREEMGLDGEDVILDVSSHKQRRRVADSLSYPGLRTQYNFHTIEAKVRGLPEGNFWRDNDAFGTGDDPVKRHHWAWRPDRD